MTNKAEGAQNVEISKKIPCIKPIIEQLEIMETYTNTHKEYNRENKEKRELECLKVLFPRMFRPIEDVDLIAGRLDFLPIGFGCVTSLGGVGHYCVFNKLRTFQSKLEDVDKSRVDTLYNYWSNHDSKAIYCNEVLNDNIGRFIDCNYPMMATARLSGLMLHYDWLCELGVDGIINKINREYINNKDNQFLEVSLEAMDLVKVVIRNQAQTCLDQKINSDEKRAEQLQLMADDLLAIESKAPKTFHQALQLIWIYALISGSINYGRLDDILGPYMVKDIESGLITKDDAYDILKSLWTLIENRRTTVNGRIIVGGYGRKHPKEADEFARIAIQVTTDCLYVEPQFTLRLTNDTPQDIYDAALDSIGKGSTYPTIYNDEVHVPAIMYGMRLDRETAEQYVPFGCTEFVIQGQSTGTPNVLLNMTKMMQMVLNDGYDPLTKVYGAGKAKIKDIDDYKTFDQLYDVYKEVLDYYIDLSIYAQLHSYKVMNREASFLFPSILMDDCVVRGKAILDGGVRYLGGTNETYGNINSSDGLYAIKKLVYEDKKYSLREIRDAALANFVGFERLHKDILNVDKYGNDLEEVDNMANDLYEYIAKGVRQSGIDNGMQYYMIVISNNQTNTEWGRLTDASYDGRVKGQFLNPANNPVGGAATSGPTAMLNSLSLFDAKYHAGSVQNIKFTPSMFNDDRKKIKYLFDTYFKMGGCHLMVTVVDRGVLEDAQIHPEKYPDLIVRVSGFSAKFVDLERDIQDEVISRTLHG
jgi:pyruvate-formate lyase